MKRGHCNMTANAKTDKFLTFALVLFAFLIGPLGVVAPKGLVLLVLTGGVAGLAHWIVAGRPVALAPRPLSFILAIFFLWSLVTALWAPDFARAASLPMKLAGLTLAGLGLVYGAGALDDASRKLLGRALFWGVVAGVGVLAVAYGYARWTGDSLWGTYYFDPLTTLNAGAVVMSLLLWPLVAGLWRQGRRRLACFIPAAVIGLLLLLSSGAALLAAGAGAVVLGLAVLFGRRGGVGVAVLLALMVLAGPFAVSQTPDVKTMTRAVAGLPQSAQHRLYMWKFALERIDEKRFLGWGMDAARALPQESRRLAPNMEIMPLHPHNGPLQIRLELGLPGAVIAAALVFFVLWLPWKISGYGTPDRLAAGFKVAAATGYISVGAVSFGVWQNWWIAMAWCLAALMSSLGVSGAPVTRPSDRAMP